MKVMNVICLLIWILQIIFGVVKFVNGETIDPAIFICAVLICIVHYLEKVFE